ncbi:di-trans,poly-cis-decaprenylcistransferase [Patescibacteria group bacterium]|nr:di-trans,poly-cis-decaprenylcistransferase [Patescibacteria group bacterium]
MTEQSHVPQHIALIMDGNRRWARKNKLAALQGHEYVSNKMIEPLAERCIERGVKYLTLWAFSTENWNREKNEVEGLMQIFRTGLVKNGERLHKLGIRLRVIGDMSSFPKDIQDGVDHWQQETAKNARLTITFALNYGGRDEILRAIQKMAQDYSIEQLRATKLSQEEFSKYLDTTDMPDPDLIIRPGGELRLSGYLPWQGVYAELYFTDILMPDFTADELDKALAEFERRTRNFGK